MGEDEGRGRSVSCPKKGSADAGRSKEAFAVNESSLGGKKESRGAEKAFGSEKRHTYACRSKETFRVDESALGGEKESRREIATAIGPRSCWPYRRYLGSEQLLARGLEPPRVSPYGPEPYASASSATRAKQRVLQCEPGNAPAS